MQNHVRPHRQTARLARHLTGLLLALVAMAGGAHAACTDPAADGVNWRRCYLDGRDLKDVSLDQAMLREATFQRSDLSGARLTHADAYRAKFLSARLDRAILDGARLIEADLTRADLTGASLKGADLRNAKLVGAIMKGADLTGARVEGADLRNADLSGARWTDGRACGEGSMGQCH
ncbi:MAG: pentapeptide repeat-containing protein [Niveispirillum sp.]|uniref:pentapeptide repeat-containing protein n=1 Tax=Niveispirillum sp. TaxID=1917217 RepID=UPI003BA759FC